MRNRKSFAAVMVLVILVKGSKLVKSYFLKMPYFAAL